MYPPDYCDRLAAVLEEWPGVVAAACGRIVAKRPKQWGDWAPGPGAYIDEVPKPLWVNYVGTGQMAFDARTLRLPTMAEYVTKDDDSELSVWLQRQGIPIRLIARPRDWPARQTLPEGARTVFSDGKAEGFAERTRTICAVPEWVVHKPVSNQAVTS